jgi:hypothetical protein
MSKNTEITAIMTIALVLGMASAQAEHPAAPTCMDITWNAAFLKSYPRAPAACQEVAVRNDKKFARFDAKVTAVEPGIVKVRFSNVAGDAGREISIKPGPDSRVLMDGKKVEYSKLRKGDQLTVWIPEREIGVISDPDDKALSTIELQ